MEDSATEWYEPQYYLRKEDLFDLSWLHKCFKIVDLKYTGVDGGICKCVLTATRPGLVGDGQMCGLTVRISPGQVCHEIKRIGYIRDRECPLEMRVGDTLILYISTAVA